VCTAVAKAQGDGRGARGDDDHFAPATSSPAATTAPVQAAAVAMSPQEAERARSGAVRSVVNRSCEREERKREREGGRQKQRQSQRARKKERERDKKRQTERERSGVVRDVVNGPCVCVRVCVCACVCMLQEAESERKSGRGRCGQKVVYHIIFFLTD
jgi:hypothetical protein